MDPLEAALSSSFTAPNVPPATTTPSTAPSKDSHAAGAASGASKRHVVHRSEELEAERLAAMDDSWREEYDQRLGSWRAENAERRVHSERLRADYERRRGAEPIHAEGLAASSVGGSFVDARDLVHGEHERGSGAHALDEVLSPAAKSQHPTRGTSGHGSGEDTSQGWEKVASDSLTSSYPSINFPANEPSATGQTSHEHAETGSSRPGQTTTARHGALALPSAAPPSVTLSIFDSSLSRRARVLALVSSLAINLVLPFINGVMLGFGEIAAKSLFAWKGWGNVASSLGLSGSSSVRRERIARRGKDTPTLLTMP